MLVSKTGKSSWAKVFPRGRALYAGLTSTYNAIEVFGTGGHASRDQYAAFLDEAAVILNKPALQQVGERFRKAAAAWDRLATALLPDHVVPFQRTRSISQEKLASFNRYGLAQLSQRQLLQKGLQEIAEEIDKDFPLNEQGCDDLLASIREAVLSVRDIEHEAISMLGEVML